MAWSSGSLRTTTAAQLLAESAAAYAATEAIAEFPPRGTGSTITNTGVLVTGRMHLQAIYLRAGQVATSVKYRSATTLATLLLNQWVALYSSALALLKVSADKETEAWAANSVKTFTFGGGAYTVPTSGLYYIGLLVVATTVPSLLGITTSAPIVGADVPILNGDDLVHTGLTTPATAPDPATLTAAAGVGSGLPWVRVI